MHESTLLYLRVVTEWSPTLERCACVHMKDQSVGTQQTFMTRKPEEITVEA